MGQATESDNFISGRIGFDQVGKTQRWDNEKKDFVDAQIRAGQTMPFTIDVPTMRLAFQLRGENVKPGTFRSNFEALLNVTGPYQWRVRWEGIQQPPWEEWLEQVRVEKVDIHMRRPNPRYPGEKVEHLFENAKLAAADLVLEAREDEEINLDEEFVKQAIELATDYGRITAKGVRTDAARPDTWNSDREGQVKKTTAPADSITGEVWPEELRKALEPLDDGETP
jgi:hypothetical protein